TLVGFAGAGDAGPSVKELLQRLKTGDPKAAFFLATHGKAATSGLIAILDNETDVFALGHAANLLGRLGPAAKDAVPALAKALAHPEPAVHDEASAALRQIGAPAVPALCNGLNDRNPAAPSRAPAAP